ncbi:MAG: NAD(P)-binding domain-containing protein [Hyphomicrobiaceae bacterium]
MTNVKSVGIVGAGAAGLCGAKHMLEEGLDVTVYEIGSNVGGMWVYQNDNGRSSAYKTLHINTARDLTNFSDLRFDSSVPPFPSHWDMARYLKDYADRFGVTQHVRFNTTITNVRPADGNSEARPKWRLETDKGEVIEHDCVLLATGHLTKPLEVAAFRDTFTGEYLHSHYYREPAQFVGKRVCIVGVGNSALDIASDLAMTSERVVLVARSNALIIPKLVFGRPFWDAVKPFYKPWVPSWVRNRVLKTLVYMVQGDMAALGFPPTAKRVHATSNANIVNHIKYKRVLVENGIERIDGKRVTFTDGRSEEFDTLIAATGYVIDLDFLDKRIVEERDNGLDLYMRIVPPDWRGLYFLAYFNSDTALNWICEGQARWLREHEMGRARLPSRDEMMQSIAQRNAWVRQHFKDTPRHGIEVEHLPYFAELKRSLRQAQRRAGLPVRDVGIGAVNALPPREQMAS